MVAEIQKLETAARMAMGQFEAPDNATSVEPRYRFTGLAIALCALAFVGLALALL